MPSNRPMASPLLLPGARFAHKYEIEIDRTLRFSVYLRKENEAWLPEVLGRMAILQPIDAQCKAEITAKVLDAEQDVSSPFGGRSVGDCSDILWIAHDAYVPLGQQRSRWQGSEEFADIAERFGKQDLCFGTGDSGGVTLETPVGESSALIQVRTDNAHPALGSGLLATLQLPFRGDETKALDICMWLNHFESAFGPRSRSSEVGITETPAGARSERRLHSSSECPLSIWIRHQRRLMAGGTGTMGKKQLWHNLHDLTMLEIFRKRHPQFARSVE